MLIIVNDPLPLSGVNSRFFRTIPLSYFPAFHLKCPTFFAYFELAKIALYALFSASSGSCGTHTTRQPASRFPAFHLKCPTFFAYFELEKLRSSQRQVEVVELIRLGNQLPVLGKANSLCEVGNTIVTTMDINDSETVYFVTQDHHLIVPCICL